MNKKILLWGVVLSVAASLCVASCGKESADQPAYEKSAPAAEEAAGTAGMQPGAPSDKRDMDAGAKKAGKMADGLGVNFLTPMDLAKGRLLEYRVEVSYECKDVLVSRKALLGLIAKYGFIKNSNASTQIRQPFANVEIMVKADLLYEALKDFESLGLLQNENITVVDHTENMVQSERKVNRENVRIIRRNKAMGQISAGAKNWQDVENAIESSEDKLDDAEQSKWQIRDIVSWAKVHIVLHGPDQPERIEVPMYQNALIGLVNFFLGFLYVLVWLSPFIGAGVLIWLFRDRIKRIFSKKI